MIGLGKHLQKIKIKFLFTLWRSLYLLQLVNNYKIYKIVVILHLFTEKCNSKKVVIIPLKLNSLFTKGLYFRFEIL